MYKILDWGRYLFPLSFLLYVGLHLGKPAVGASFVPGFLPWPLFWNYLTAICIAAFITSTLMRRYDKLAYTLMALYVILMAFMVHLPRAIAPVKAGTEMAAGGPTQEQELLNVFRNLMTAGALMGFARYIASDKRIIG